MLLNDLHHIDQLDSEIAELHQRLNDLYQERSSLIVPNKAAMKSIAGQYSQTFSQPHSAEVLYQQLLQAWTKREVTIPAFSTLKARLQKVTRVEGEIIHKYPELAGQMRLILVPPTNILNQLLAKDHTEGNQQIVMKGDLEAYTKWRLLTVYAGAHGLELNHPTTKTTQLKGLGVNEYIALVAQEELLIDERQWTVLLKGTRKNSQTAPCVKYTNQSYYFMNDEIDSIFNDNGFRPAQEIN